MTMTHEQLHTHGRDELATLRAECDKWHKAYDRVWEEHMRFADRAIELEKENSNLKRDNEQLLLRADNWKSLCFAGNENIAELEKKFQEAESCSPMIPINRWKKISEELPSEEMEGEGTGITNPSAEIRIARCKVLDAAAESTGGMIMALKAIESATAVIGNVHLVYPKEDADKVIAELEKNLSEIQSQKMQLEDDVALLRRNNAELKKERDWLAKDRSQAYDDLEKRAQLNIKQEESIRHANYKRCLAMASNCRLRARWFGDNAFYKKEQRALQKHQRWLKLAEKFKEAK